MSEDARILCSDRIKFKLQFICGEKNKIFLLTGLTRCKCYVWELYLIESTWECNFTPKDSTQPHEVHLVKFIKG